MIKKTTISIIRIIYKRIKRKVINMIIFIILIRKNKWGVLKSVQNKGNKKLA
ncbi:hypothetical protein CLG_0016 (plasmid) [Clostridium botulinum D str. 1873]|uniref:Uncharacterized protein n=1 Tax=Clostridium botulinum D str. 1873 TaxID=592027 RepID=A0A9N7FZ27_CLOBO|nr:hypothetical protein CLG_0016 [Clostridium botulinum D str. 1873]